MTSLRIAILAAAAIGLAWPAVATAQQAPAAPAQSGQAPAGGTPAGAAPSTATGAAPTLPQPEPPASQLAAARDLVVASGMSRSFKPMVPQLTEQIVPMMTRVRPDLTKDLTEVVAQLGPEFTQKTEDMIDIAAHIYARRMNEDELKQAAAFFKSPVGQKYVDAQPAMLDDLVVAMQSWTQQISTYMMTRVRQEMIKKGHNDF